MSRPKSSKVPKSSHQSDVAYAKKVLTQALDHYYRIEDACDQAGLVPKDQSTELHESLEWMQDFLFELLEQRLGVGAVAQYFTELAVRHGQAE
jgi:hypothetical protein